jgi:hypothetical protein
LNERPERQSYKITVNGKLCYVYWENPDKNMLYVDGYNTRYNNQWDVKSALTSRTEYDSLFNTKMNDVDVAIDKAIKHFELTQGLKGDAKDTWSDILNLESLVLEEMKDRRAKILRYATDEELKEAKSCVLGKLYKPDFSKGWIFKRNDREFLVLIAIRKSIAHSVNKVVYLHYYRGINNKWRYTAWSGDSDDIHKAIKHFELTQGLKGDAKDTWEDILS